MNQCATRFVIEKRGPSTSTVTSSSSSGSSTSTWTSTTTKNLCICSAQTDGAVGKVNFVVASTFLSLTSKGCDVGCSGRVIFGRQSVSSLHITSHHFTSLHTTHTTHTHTHTHTYTHTDKSPHQFCGARGVDWDVLLSSDDSLRWQRQSQ